MRREEEEELGRRHAFNRRALLLGALGTAGFGVLAARLYQIQVMHESRYGLLAETNRISTQIVPPPRRGRILDRFGEVLATGEEAFRATLVPSLAADVEAVVRTFARIVPIGEREVARLVARARRQRPNEPIVLAGDLSFEQASVVNLLAPQLPGVQTEIAERRIYPKGRLVGHLVGHIGHVGETAIDDDPMLRLAWIKAGRSGIERGQEPRLAGVSGRVKLEVDARGRIVRNVDRREPLPGRDVVSTIDIELQTRALELIARERCASIVVMDVRGGEVVASASVPGYDPGRIVDGLSPLEWQRLSDAADDPMLDRATAGQYPPASTFKMVTALAALEAGLVEPRDRVECSGTYTLADHQFRCWDRGGHGRMDMLAALRQSCDVYFYEMGRRLGIDRIAAMARRLGLGQTFDCGLALPKAGVVPDGDWKIGALGKRWLGGETLHAAIGQGYVLATPLQLAVMTARIATGRAVSPRFVRPLAGETPVEVDYLGLDLRHLEIVRKGMHAAVNGDGGTASRAVLDDADGVLAGKTGTAEVAGRNRDDGGGEVAWNLRNHALFVAYAPFHAPRYAVSVIVEHGGSGGVTAAPIAREIMTATLRRDPVARPPFELAGERTSALAPGAAPAPDGVRTDSVRTAGERNGAGG